ncbi:MAG: 50S ribosomal protein L1 [Candidatus Thermoplasmatota archaeon]|jgi:large subunit ribosomal protein L1|nr:50S ribosomal protein L1 [Euryarchaeota archaeon]MEC7744341.1 50S ribosomal protein L1 [Candidatus Thermoplasmatota archaeon]MED5273634.1 50S ribosomal protein L1 [Candidatus Thermoplasmatota archaeon]|tara:strand:- start:1104 stop:1748 length:645 start_codon:yes stop_codon:yes gene_type:complete
MKEKIQDAIQQALDESPERNFVESLEISFTLRDVDLKNPANRIQEEVRLPSGRGKPVRIAMFAGGEMSTKAKAAGIEVIDPSQIEDIGGNRQQARKMANRYDFFLSEIPHMGTVGRFLGVVLGPRGKMPRPVPPNVDPGMIAAGLKDTAIVRSRDKVTFHTAMGSREQGIGDLTANGMAIWTRVVGKLERGAGNIRSCYVKTSMGPSIKVEVVL